MCDVRRTRAFFTSQRARNDNGRFIFSFREPIFYVESIKLRKLIIANFAGIANSPYYFLRTDCISLTRDAPTLNGVPAQLVCVLPYSPHTPGLAVDIDEGDESEAFNRIWTLQSVWFEILDSNGNIINPPDLNWSFCVELQIIINGTM